MKHFNAVVLRLALAAIATGVAHAQAISGDLVGIVKDSSGAAIPGASVSALNVGTKVQTTANANTGGEYRFGNLLPGRYDISATANGFTRTTLKGVDVLLNTTSTANLTLEIGAVAESVNVTESTAILDTTTAQIQTTYGTKLAEDLPNVSVGAGVINLSLLQGGVASSGGVGVGMGPSIGGQRPRNNNFTVEGIDNNAKGVTGPVVFIPNDDVAEFTLLQNQFRSEYGHSSGGQFNTIVKSGTNEYHGMLYEYLQNRDFNALNQTFKNQGIYSNPRFDQSRLGANVGGPILKKKLFFFAGFEYNPLGQASTVGSPVYAPTSAGYATLSAIPAVNQTNLKVAQTYATAPALTPGAPAITVGGVSVPTGIIPISSPNFSNGYFGVLSVDYNLSERDQLRGRYMYNRGDAISTGATLPSFFTTVPARFHLATLAEYHTFTPNLTNEFRFGYQRQNSTSPVGSQTFPGLSAFPNLQFNDLGLQVGPNPSFPQSTINNLYQFADAVAWVRGKHTFKAGYEFRDSISPQFFSQRVRGDYEYTTFSNYLLDTTPDFLAQRNVGGRLYYGNQLASYAFVQDTWRLTQRLTLDLGARYEYTTVPKSEKDQSLNAGASAPPLLPIGAPKAYPSAIAPRLGLAFTPEKNGNTVIRAGFGMAYDVLFDNLGLNTVPPQYAVTVDVTNSGGANFLKNGGITSAPGGSSTSVASLRANTTSFVPDQLPPYSVNWNFGVQRILRKDYTVEARYVGTTGIHQVLQQQINKLSPITASNDIPTFLAAPGVATLQGLALTVAQLRAVSAVDPRFAALGFNSTITSYRPEGHTSYHGLALQLNKRFAHGLQYQAAYTWSHNIDDSTAEVASTYLTPRRAQNFNAVSAEKASSALDRRHRFTVALLYDAPFYQASSNWFLKNLAGNWQVAPIYTYESPEYFTVQSGLDSNLNGDSAPDRAIVNPNGAAGTGSDVYGLDRNGNVIPLTTAAAANNVVAWVASNPNARYIRAGYGAYANGGRNTEATRPINNVDLSLYKRFNINERMRFTLGADALNLFNHAQFSPGSSNNSGAVSTFASSVLNYVDITAATLATRTFNNPEMAFSSKPRTLQVVLKFTF